MSINHERGLEKTHDFLLETIPNNYQIHKDPHQILWRSVVRQMLLDALMEPKTHIDNKHKREALRWLNQRNPDFIAACEYSGYYPKKVLAQFEEWKAAGKVPLHFKKVSY